MDESPAASQAAFYREHAISSVAIAIGVIIFLAAEWAIDSGWNDTGSQLAYVLAQPVFYGFVAVSLCFIGYGVWRMARSRRSIKSERNGPPAPGHP